MGRASCPSISQLQRPPNQFAGLLRQVMRKPCKANRKRSTIEVEDTPLQRQFDVVIERDEEDYYVASVPQLPSCHTQARSLDEVTERIREAIELCLEVEGAPEQSLEFVGIQRVTIAA